MPAISVVTIADHIARGYAVSAHCLEGHSSRLDLERLAGRLGPDFELMHDTLVPRLRCSVCGQRASGITVAWVRPEHLK